MFSGKFSCSSFLITKTNTFHHFFYKKNAFSACFQLIYSCGRIPDQACSLKTSSKPTIEVGTTLPAARPRLLFTERLDAVSE